MSNSIAAPNPRQEAPVVWLLTLAAREGLDIRVGTRNPTRGSIHAKLLLVQADGET